MSLSFTPKVQKAPGSCNKFSHPEGEVNSAHINPTLANLKYQRLRATGLLFLHRLLHKNMGMTARNEINSIDLCWNLRPAYLSLSEGPERTKERLRTTE